MKQTETHTLQWIGRCQRPLGMNGKAVGRCQRPLGLKELS